MLLALPAIIRLGWEDLPGRNTLAYYEHLLITDVKSFMALGPGANILKLSCTLFMNVCIKLECLSLASFYSLF
jgi:hypothetical protein